MWGIMLCFHIGAVMHDTIMARYATNFEDVYLKTCFLWIEIIFSVLNKL